METLVCRIELDKEEGLILTVENDDESIVQTIVMNGTSITSTVEGSKDSSSITQTQDSVFMKCSNFVLNAETITCKSTKATQLQSGAARGQTYETKGLAANFLYRPDGKRTFLLTSPFIEPTFCCGVVSICPDCVVLGRPARRTARVRLRGPRSQRLVRTAPTPPRDERW